MATPSFITPSDDHTRLAYSEILGDERKETAAGFWSRANAYFNSHGVTVKQVLTDNGSCYRSHLFKQTLGPEITHKRTRPYRPQTNGKVERFNRTLNQEWAYVGLRPDLPVRRGPRPDLPGLGSSLQSPQTRRIQLVVATP